MKRWKLFGLCAALAGTLSLVGAGVIANAEMAETDTAVKTVLGSTAEAPSEELSIKEVVSNSMPAMVAITNTSVQDVRNYFGGNRDIFGDLFGDFFGYGGYGYDGYGYGYGYGNGNGGSNQQKSVSRGTGIIVGETDTDILIATNQHVISEATELSVAFIDETAAEAEVVGSDKGKDIALVKVAKSDLSEDTLDAICVIPIGKSEDLVVGEEVVAIGNALGYGQSASHGIISALGRSVSAYDEMTGEVDTVDDMIQTDAAINPGNSGGALLNMYGELIGINEAKSTSIAVEGVGYAVPIDTAEPILSAIANGEQVDSSESSDIEAGAGNAFLGITCVTISEEYANAYGIPTGAYVSSIESGSAAEQAGIRVGDIITAVDGTSVSSATDLKNLISHYSKGDSAELTLVCFSMSPDGRGGANDNNNYSTTTVTVTFGSLDNDEAA